jgi:hypothetical protein
MGLTVLGKGHISTAINFINRYQPKEGVLQTPEGWQLVWREIKKALRNSSVAPSLWL